MGRLRWGLSMVLAWRVFGPIVTPRFKPGQRHPWRIPGRLVYVGDREYLVRQTGPEDGPPVVLIHGLGGSSLAEWYRIGPTLAERFRVSMLDYRSHGLSPKVSDRFQVEDVADEVAAVMTAAGIDRAHVVGYSMGGTVAQALAYRHPHRVDRLALVGTFSSHPPAWRRLRVVGVWLTRAWERVTGFGSPEVRALYLLAVKAVPAENARWLWEETHRRDPEAGAASGFSLLRFDSSAWVGRLTQPALVVIPLADQLVPIRWQYDLAAALADARVLELPGARHEAPLTHAEQITDALVEFFEKG